MKSIYQLYSKHQKLSFLFLAAIMLVGSFFIFQPSANIFFGENNAKKLTNSFIKTTTSTSVIDPQLFWATREFSSLGHFEYKREGFENEEIQHFLTENDIQMSTDFLYPFLTFTSQSWKSVEFLSGATAFDDNILQLKTQCQNIIFEKKNEFICNVNDEYYLIVFLKPLSEMAKANAFFDVAGRDGKIVKGRNWLVVSLVQM